MMTALLAPLMLSCTRPLPVPPASPTTERGMQLEPGIRAAAEAYVRAHARITEFVVEPPVVNGDYARVRVAPAAVGAAPQWVYLVRQGINWQGLTMGASFDAATYDLLGIPAALRLTAVSTPPGGR